MNQRPNPPAAALAAIALLLGYSACSSGPGSGVQPGKCARLADGGTGTLPLPMLPNSLYAELRNAAAPQAPLGVNLSGTGGSYAGASGPLDRCSPAGSYVLERTVLVNAQGAPVATAVRDPNNNNYLVSYAGGMSTTVGGANFSNLSTSYTPTWGPPPTVTMLTISTAAPNQGDKLTVTAAATDPCGIRQMQFWLTNAQRTMTSPAATIMSGSGAAPLRVPPEFPAGPYFLEGRVTSLQNHSARLLRQTMTDANYTYSDENTGSSTASTLAVVSLSVGADPNADRVPPDVVSLQASVQTAARCQAVGLTLKLHDDRALPAMQTVRLLFTPLVRRDLTVSVTLSGGGDTLSGSFTVPQDAPAGVWFGYPESIQDAAGNVATGSLDASTGRFTVGGSMPVLAATFVVPQDPQQAPDLGTVMPDLSMPGSGFPATLIGISVTPSSLMATQSATVQATWRDNASILR